MNANGDKATGGKAAEREARLAARLRDNLRRRKQQARGAPSEPAPAESQETGAPAQEPRPHGAVESDPPLSKDRWPS